MYSLGDRAKNVTAEIIHIEGDPDHPVNRGTLCPKGAGLLDFVHSPNRLKYPEIREPGATEWKRIGWDEALTRIAKLMKADRDANFMAHERRRQDRQPLAHHRHAGGLGVVERDRATSRTRRCARWGCSSSTIRRASDTDRRWPVWPRRSDAER